MKIKFYVEQFPESLPLSAEDSQWTGFFFKSYFKDK